MPPLWCGPCWTKHNTRTPATWDVDGDLYCDACKDRSGYEKQEGKRLGRADAVASSNTMAAATPQKALKAHAVVVPIPERLKQAIQTRGQRDLPSAAIDRTFGPLKESAEEVQLAIGNGDANDKKVANTPPSPAEQEKGTPMRVAVEIDWPMYDKLKAEGKTCGAIATLLGVAKSTLDRYVATRNGTPRKQLAPGVAPSSAPSPVRTTCSVAGCVRELRDDNRSGICSEHRARSGRPTVRPRKTPLASPSNGKDYEVPPYKGVADLRKNLQKLLPPAMATICVPASALDSWWAKLSIDERAGIFSDYISRVEA
jgi:hypothetical protein